MSVETRPKRFWPFRRRQSHPIDKHLLKAVKRLSRLATPIQSRNDGSYAFHHYNDHPDFQFTLHFVYGPAATDEMNAVFGHDEQGVEFG